MHCEGKGVVMKKLVSLAMLTILFGCSYSITQVHTEGSAQDVVDDTETTDVDPSITVPASLI